MTFCFHLDFRVTLSGNVGASWFEIVPMIVIIVLVTVVSCIHFAPLQIRLYILQGNNLTGHDDDNLSDPYLVVKFGASYHNCFSPFLRCFYTCC